MLVLSRKVNESIRIVDDVTGEAITIMVTSARGQVRLGFEAAQRFRIERTNGGTTEKFIRGDNPSKNP